MITLLVMHDGRDTIHQTIPSAEAFLDGPISQRIIHCDGPTVDADKLTKLYPGYRVIWPAPERQGFAGAIRRAWQLIDRPAPYIFHLEDDFTFTRTIDLLDMAGILERHPDLVNLALRRQPWNPAEATAGGIVEQYPEEYLERTDPLAKQPWLEHRLFFTTNPGMYRRSLIVEHEWPDGPHSEGMFSIALREDPGRRFGYYGARDSGEWVHHIGNVRNGIGY